MDFTEPVELALFIDDSQLTFLDGVMSDQGFPDGKQMAGAFTLLNQRDLVFSRIVRDYWLGGRMSSIPATVSVQLPGQRPPAAGYEAPVAMLNACHERVQRTLALLQRLVDDGGHLPPTWVEETRELFQHFVSLYEHHIPDEERLVFPAGERVIRAGHLALMAQDMMQRRGVSLG